MRWQGPIMVTMVAASLLSRCQLSTAADLDPPRLLAVSLQSGAELTPTDPIRLTFSRPLDPGRLEPSPVVVVPHKLLGPCSEDLACAGDPCHRGRCQRSTVTESWIADLANPPLSAARLARAVPAALRLEEEAELVWEPTAPMEPHRLHSLLVGPGLFDGEGNPVSPEPGSRLVLQQVFATAGAETARPQLALGVPADGAVEVPTNLARALVLFSRPVLGVEPESLYLRRADARRVAARLEVDPPRCRARPLGTCFELRLLELLPRRQRIEVIATEAVRDLRGRPVLLGRAPAFATSVEPDRRPPRAAAVRVQVSDRCAVVRVQVDEPADLGLQPLWGETERWSLGRASHEVALVAPAQLAGSFRGVLEDLAGNRQDLGTVEVPAGDLAPRIVLTEVLANPAGPEPAQELVELLNLEPVPVSLAGWSLDDNDDGIGRAELPDAVLPPGQLAVVVGPKFDPALQDPPLPAGALLVRLGQTIGQAGLANSGEPLVLRDPQGQLVSSYLGVLPGKPGQGRSIERVQVSGCDVADNWRLEPGGRSSPGLLPAPSGGQP